MSAPVAPLGPLPSDKHRAVLEVYNAFRAVCFACRATATNPTGKADLDEARRRLDRLRYSLVPFPDRRLYPDPFAALNNGRVRLDFNTLPPPGLDLEAPDPVQGATSVHDATVRLAGRHFDLLLVVKLYECVDPKTGERSMVPNYPYGYKREVVDIINGKPVKSKVTGIVNLPETEHYTAVPWSADLWDRLHKLHAPELAAYAWSPAFNPHPGQLRAELEREAALVPDPSQIGTAGTADGGECGVGEQRSAGPAPRDLGPQPAAKPKRSTERGEGRAKLVAALTRHHRYENGSCLNHSPINNNELARFADVDKATASAFFKREFGDHTQYKAICRDSVRLAASLKHLNGEYTPRELFGMNLPDADEHDEK